MKETVESVAKWADETFGECTPKKALIRAFDEIDELFEAHSQPDRTISSMVEEAADVCITLYRYIYLVDPDAIEKKMAINRARKWKLDGKGTAQHE